MSSLIYILEQENHIKENIIRDFCAQGNERTTQDIIMNEINNSTFSYIINNFIHDKYIWPHIKKSSSPLSNLIRASANEI